MSKTFGSKSPAEHDKMMAEMMALTGVDLCAARNTGEVSTADYLQQVARCRECMSTDACEAFLNERTGDFREPPEFCRNKAVFDRLRAQQV